jgi:cell division protein ZapD
MSIRSRVGIPGWHREFDLPAYYAWQHKAALRQADLQRWIAPLVPLPIPCGAAVAAETLVHRKGYGCAGHYQQTLPQGRTCAAHAHRSRAGSEPEISGNRLMVSVPDASRQR